MVTRPKNTLPSDVQDECNATSYFYNIKKNLKNEVSTLTIVFLWYLEGFHFYLQISKSTLKNEKLLHAGWWKVSDLLSWLVNFAGEEQHKIACIRTFFYILRLCSTVIQCFQVIDSISSHNQRNEISSYSYCYWEHIESSQENELSVFRHSDQQINYLVKLFVKRPLGWGKGGSKQEHLLYSCFHQLYGFMLLL